MVKVVTDVVDPLLLTTLRLGLAALAALIAGVALGAISRETYLSRTAVVLAVMNALGFLLQHVGISISTASKGALLINVNVVFIAVLSVVFLKERMSSAKVAGVVLGLTGVTFLTTRLDPATLVSGEAVGDLLIFLGGVSWAVYVILTKRALDRGSDVAPLTVGVLGWTAILLLPLLLVTTFPAALPMEIWAAVLYLGAMCSGFALFLWIVGLKGVTATVSSVLLFGEVLFAILLSVAFLGESFGLVEGVGGLLILVALLLAGGSAENEVTRR